MTVIEVPRSLAIVARSNGLINRRRLRMDVQAAWRRLGRYGRFWKVMDQLDVAKGLKSNERSDPL